ncbi:hypothetical protein [Pontimicrobium sp. MEBiC06410]
MKTILYLFIALFMSANMTSCNPNSIVEDELIEQANGDCCDEEVDIPPPPTNTSGTESGEDGCCDEEGDIPPTP